jgi:hypothetical protein
VAGALYQSPAGYDRPYAEILSRLDSIERNLVSLLRALGLEMHGGWTVVRAELARVLDNDTYAAGKELYRYFLTKEMPFRCFLNTASLEERSDVVSAYFPLRNIHEPMP